MGDLCRPRTEQTVNIYSVAGQAEEQSQFSLIFFFWSSGVSPCLWKRGHILYLVGTNCSYCSSAKSGSRFTASVTDGETEVTDV